MNTRKAQLIIYSSTNPQKLIHHPAVAKKTIIALNYFEFK